VVLGFSSVGFNRLQFIICGNRVTCACSDSAWLQDQA